MAATAIATVASTMTRPVIASPACAAARRETRKWQRHFADRAGLNKLIRGWPESGAGPTTTVVGSMCGSHTTHARSALRLGSAAKSQPPLVGHLFGYFSECISCAGDGLVGGPVGAIASEKLPGERGGAKIIEIGAGVGIPPIALVWHLSYPPVSDAPPYGGTLLPRGIAVFIWNERGRFTMADNGRSTQ
jgi:hypothetical protein